MAMLAGVVETESGYANGLTLNPTYQDVINGSGHAEAVKAIYDPSKISLNKILDMYAGVVDPISLNKQGNDVGRQYRTGIYYIDGTDLPVIREFLSGLEAKYKRPVVIEVMPLNNYTPAEEWHQKYLDKNPGGYCHIGPEAFGRAAAYKPRRGFTDKELTPIQYSVVRQNATEPPFANEYWNNHAEGIYVDITTGEPLFTSKDKFDSGCGWPSFTKPIEDGLLRELADASHGMRRAEVRSTGGDAHLGHVFPDGPKASGGLRYCINSASLRFIARENMEKEGYGELLQLFSQ